MTGIVLLFNVPSTSSRCHSGGSCQHYWNISNRECWHFPAKEGFVETKDPVLIAESSFICLHVHYCKMLHVHAKFEFTCLSG